MHDNPVPVSEAEDFIHTAIDSVPHLESLLLLWTSRPRAWSVAEVAEKLYIDTQRAYDVLASLERRGLLVAEKERGYCFRYEAQSARQDALVCAVEHVYKSDLIRITRMIHSKATPAVREFAQAFRFRKDQP